MLILFLCASGVHSWAKGDYGKKRSFFVYSTASAKDTKKNESNIKSALSSVKGLQEHPIGARSVSSEQLEMEAKEKANFGSGGAYVWQIDADPKPDTSSEVRETDEGKNQSYKGNVNNATIVKVFLFQAIFAKRPTLFVIDNAPYHKNTKAYSPYKSAVTLKETIAFLKQQDPGSELGKLWSEVRADNDGCTLRRAQLIERVKALMDVTLNDLEVALAEIGIRQFGVPHRVLFLPPRMPEFNPVEFLWAWVKHYYMTHRLPKRESSGALSGVQGVELTRSVITETLCMIQEAKAINTFKHVEATIEKFRTSSVEVASAIDEIVEQKVSEARSLGHALPVTRSTAQPSQAMIEPSTRSRSATPSSSSSTLAQAASVEALTSATPRTGSRLQNAAPLPVRFDLSLKTLPRSSRN